MSAIIGAPNVYTPVEWVSTTVADQSELQNAMREMAEAGIMPLQQIWGKAASQIDPRPTLYLVGWREVKQEGQ